MQAYARANNDARVTFLGTRRDIAAIYADLDIAVHPSLSENLGGAAESLLFGVPTVTTDVGGFPDLIADGVTGRMVPPRDPASLADAMRDLLADRNRASAAWRSKDAAMRSSCSTSGTRPARSRRFTRRLSGSRRRVAGATAVPVGAES